MNRSQASAASLALVLFASGVLAGILGHRYYAGAVVNAKPSEDFRHHYVAEMRSRLKLTSEQVDRLEVILDETKAKYKKIRESIHPALVEIKREQTSRVKSILTPAQIPIYEKMVTERERHAKEQDDRERQQDRHMGSERSRAGSP